MEVARGESWERECVMSEVSEGIKLATNLKRHLHQQSSMNSSDCGLLIDEIVSCYDNALALLSYMDSTTTLLRFKDHHVFADLPNKRKSLATWSEEVHVCSGLEGEHEDGYNWRKYGQKYILGATHPRSYYRCSHRRTRGCSATKQVQRREDEPRINKVVYRGKHTCVPKHDIAQSNDELINHQNVAPQFNLTSQSYINLPHTDALPPLGDLDFLIDDDDVDFDTRFMEISHFFSRVQDYSPSTNMM